MASSPPANSSSGGGAAVAPRIQVEPASPASQSGAESPPPRKTEGPAAEAKGSERREVPLQVVAPRIDRDNNDKATTKEETAAGSTKKSELDEKIEQEKGFDPQALLHVPDFIALHPLLANWVAEAMGTFIFTLTIALVGINNPHPAGKPETNITPIPVGFMLMCMVFTFGYISGGHFNPAVTFAVLLTRREGFFKSIVYIACQCGAALGAGVVALIIQGDRDLIVPRVQGNTAEYVRKGIFAELIFTFALSLVVLNVAYSRQKANFFYGFAIGMVLVAGLASVGGVSGAAFNPAVATGLQAAVCLVGKCDALLHLWLYWVAPMSGAALAALLFLNMATGDDTNEITG